MALFLSLLEYEPHGIITLVPYCLPLYRHVSIVDNNGIRGECMCCHLFCGFLWKWVVVLVAIQSGDAMSVVTAHLGTVAGLE